MPPPRKDNNLPHRNNRSYLHRLKCDKELEEKLATACYVAETFGKKISNCFVGPGTAAVFAGIELLKVNPNIRVMTHTYPFSWHVMKLIYDKLLEPDLHVQVLSGRADLTTGIIEHRERSDIPDDYLLHSPFSVNAHSVSGNRNVDSFKRVWPKCRKKIILATGSKLVNPVADPVRSVGKITSDIKEGEEYHLVIPKDFSRNLEQSGSDKANKTVDALANIGVTIHLVTKPASKKCIARTIIGH